VLPDKRQVVGEACGDPALRDGHARSPTGSGRHRATGANLGSTSVTSTFRLVRSRRPQPRSPAANCQNTAGPMRSICVPSAYQWPFDLADRSHRAAGVARKPCCIRPCYAVSTVLGPGSDGYHEDAYPFDLMERARQLRICQWDVWDPLPQTAPLLPAERSAGSTATRGRRPNPMQPTGCGEIHGAPADAKTDVSDPEPNRSLKKTSLNKTSLQQKSAGKPAALIVLQRRHLSAGYCIRRTVAGALQRHLRIIRRVAVASASSTDHDRTETDAVIEIDHVLVGHRMQPEEIDSPIYRGWCRESGTACSLPRSRDKARASPSDVRSGSHGIRNARPRDFAGASDARAATRSCCRPWAMPTRPWLLHRR